MYTELQKELGETVSKMELEMYREMLNECYEPVMIAGSPRDYSDVLETIDPVAFRIGFYDYLDSLRED